MWSLWLASFTYHNVFEIHPCFRIYQYLTLAHDLVISQVYMYHIVLIHLSVDGHLGFFQFWAILNNAAMNIHAPVFFVDICFHPLGKTSRSGIAGSYCNSMFNIFGKYQTVFQCTIENSTILHIHLHILRIIISLRLTNSYYFLSFFFSLIVQPF